MDEKKKIILTVKQVNNLDATVDIIYHGESDMVCFEDGFQIHYFEDFQKEVYFTFRTEEIRLRRRAEVHTEINFKEMDLAKMSINSPFGVMNMKSYTHYIGHCKNQLVIHYDVVNNHDVIASYQSEWLWEERINESN